MADPATPDPAGSTDPTTRIDPGCSPCAKPRSSRSATAYGGPPTAPTAPATAIPAAVPVATPRRKIGGRIVAAVVAAAVVLVGLGAGIATALNPRRNETVGPSNSASPFPTVPITPTTEPTAIEPTVIQPPFWLVPPQR